MDVCGALDSGVMPKITVTVDADLLARIDDARADGQTRSGWIAAAARRALPTAPPPSTRVDPRPFRGVIGRG